MLDATVTLSAGVLTVDAGSEATTASIYRFLDKVRVSYSPSSSGYRIYQAADVKKIVFEGSPHADVFSNNTNIPDTIRGYQGNDTLNGGDGRSLIEGGNDNDTITGGAGNDTIRGGYGNDTIDAQDGNDFVGGWVGNDTILGGNGRDTLDGGDGSDSIRGGQAEDLIFGGEGDDELFGDQSDDTIHGGDGNDTIRGGSHNDTIFGNKGSDHIYGDDDGLPFFQGNDRLIGGDGDDWLYGYGGNDTLEGQAQHDHLFGGNGNDTLLGGYGNDTLMGEAGNDVLRGDVGQDHFGRGTMPSELKGSDFSSEDTVDRTRDVELIIKDLYCIDDSDNQGDEANEVYFMITGNEGGTSFGPVEVGEVSDDGNWKMHQHDKVPRIPLWHGDLAPGESMVFVVSMWDHDNAVWDALAEFGLAMLGAIRTIPGLLSADPASFAAVLDVTVKGVERAIDRAQRPSDDLLGVFVVGVVNRGGSIETEWRASSHAMRYERTQTEDVHDVEIRTTNPDGDFKLKPTIMIR